MSPEQVRGQGVDHRSDIFAFGAILYEMLTGRRAFQRETMAETMTAILKEEPDEVTQLNNKITPQLERIVQRCLEKKPERRFQSASDLGFAIEAVSTPSGPRVDTSKLMSSDTVTTIRHRVLGNSRLAWIVAAFLLLGLVIVLTFALRRPGANEPSSSPLVRYEVQPPSKSSLSLTRWPAIAISPDGSTVAFVASGEGINRLYLRSRDDTEVRAISGTEGAYDPVFSPDGKWIAFIADFTIKKVAVDGPVTTVLKVSDARGLSWLNEDALIFSANAGTPLFQVSTNGGESKQISKLDETKNERTHRWPQVLPGAKAVLFTVGTLDSPDDYDRANIEAVILATGERRVILRGASMARYAQTGHLVNIHRFYCRIDSSCVGVCSL